MLIVSHHRICWHFFNGSKSTTNNKKFNWAIIKVVKFLYHLYKRQNKDQHCGKSRPPQAKPASYISINPSPGCSSSYAVLCKAPGVTYNVAIPLPEYTPQIIIITTYQTTDRCYGLLTKKLHHCSSLDDRSWFPFKMWNYSVGIL